MLFTITNTNLGIGGTNIVQSQLLS